MVTICEQDFDVLKRKAQHRFIDAIEEVLEEKEDCIIAIPGGRSVTALFEGIEESKRIEWHKVHLFMVDERLVNLDSPESNFKQMRNLFIDKLILSNKLAKSHVHPFIFNPHQEDHGVGAYRAELHKFGGHFDIVVLGVGEDGHVAALFPNHPVLLNEQEFFITIYDAPKLPADRMTSSPKLIMSATITFLLFIGDGKKEAYKNFKDPSLYVEQSPAKMVMNTGTNHVITDITDV